MNAKPQHGDAWERAAWILFVGCIAMTPLAVSKFAFLDLPMTYDVFAFPQTVVFTLGVAVALALWGVAVLAGQARVSLSRPMIAFGLFLGWSAVATVAGYEPLRSLFGSSMSPLSLVGITTYSILVFLATQMIGSGARMKALTWVVVGSATAVGLVALVQQLFQVDFFGIPSIEPWMTDHGFSTIGNPDHLGTFLVLPVLLSVFLVLFEQEAYERFAAGACLAVLLSALTGTTTRGAWIAVVAGGFLTVVLLLRSRAVWKPGVRTVVVLGVCLAAVALALVATDYPDLISRLKPSPTSVRTGTTAETVNALSSDRLDMWETTLRIVSQRPLTGTGPAAFQIGWYPNAIAASSGGGQGNLVDDPHSLVAYVVATTGVPGLIAYLIAAAIALVAGARHAFALAREGALSGKAGYYVSWFVGAVALQVALLVAAVSTPIVMYAFLTFAVLLLPSARSASGTPATRSLTAAVAVVLAVALAGAVYPSVAAEVALARALEGGSLSPARAAANSVPWNLDVQQAYFHLRVNEVDRALASAAPSARSEVDALARELTSAAIRQPHELYFPSVSAQVLRQAADTLGDQSCARAAVRAADDALAIMPAHIPTRVNKALALSELRRYAEMARALAGYWQYELSSPYPGILYAQGLALSGRPQAARDVFDQLLTRFPSYRAAIEDARTRTGESPTQQ